jgi:hypothetical protein
MIDFTLLDEYFVGLAADWIEFGLLCADKI